MVYPESWILRLEQESPENVWPKHRFWLAVANSETNEEIQELTEWRKLKEKVDIPLPSSGSFYARLGASDIKINSTINWIHKLEITVPGKCNNGNIFKISN